MTALDQLRGLRRLLAPRGTWLPLFFRAEDAGGRSCPARAREAVRWDIVAGLVRVGGDLDERLRAADLIREAVGTKWLHSWEQAPGRREDEVLDAVDRAIALAGGRA